MSSLIADVVEVYKKGQGIQNNFEFKKVVSSHMDMLDHRKTQKYYSQEQMWQLVADEYNVLDLLISTFKADISNNREDLLFSILSLAEMLSVSLKYFDEVYYFENKERISTGQYWHLSHDSWVQSYDTLSSPSFMEMIQDFGCFELGLNTVENDCFYINFYDQVKGFKQDVLDNQEMILAIDDWDLFKTILNTTNQEIKAEIETAFNDVGLSQDYYQEGLLAALA